MAQDRNGKRTFFYQIPLFFLIREMELTIILIERDLIQMAAVTSETHVS